VVVVEAVVLLVGQHQHVKQAVLFRALHPHQLHQQLHKVLHQQLHKVQQQQQGQEQEQGRGVGDTAAAL
jgi:3-methyladenine DNA glycosylase Mpg